MNYGNTERLYDGVSADHYGRLHLYNEGDGDFTTTIMRSAVTSVDVDWTKCKDQGAIMIHCVDGRTYELVGDETDQGEYLLELRDAVWGWLDMEAP